MPQKVEGPTKKYGVPVLCFQHQAPFRTRVQLVYLRRDQLLGEARVQLKGILHHLENYDITLFMLKAQFSVRYKTSQLFQTLISEHEGDLVKLTDEIDENKQTLGHFFTTSSPPVLICVLEPLYYSSLPSAIPEAPVNDPKRAQVAVFCFEEKRPLRVEKKLLSIARDEPLTAAQHHLQGLLRDTYDVTLYILKPEYYQSHPTSQKISSLLDQHANDLGEILEVPSLETFDNLVTQETSDGLATQEIPLILLGIVESNWDHLTPQRAKRQESVPRYDIPSRYWDELDRAVLQFRQRPPPSSSASSAGYEKEQSTDGVGLYDGRVAQKNGISRSAPPIELYHPVFGDFLQGLHSTEPIPEDILQLTATLMRKLSVIRVREKDRDDDIRTIVHKLAGIPLVRAQNWDNSTPDASGLCSTMANEAAMSLTIEWKPELASGNADPSTQASFSYCKSHVSPERENIMKACSCPSFLISIAGPWLLISGAIFTTRPIVQRLTDYQWLGRARVNDSAQVFKIARTFQALRGSLQKLQSYYAELRIPSPPPHSDCVHPRFFPHITSYPLGDQNGSRVEFAYVRPLQSSIACVCFEAVILETEEHVIVKFVSQYSQDAHEYMARQNMAPSLRYFGPLDPHSPHTYAALSMVVMDKVEGQTLHDLYGAEEPIPRAVIEKVFAAAEQLEAGGFVHGDLRRPNVMLTHSAATDPHVQLIDFDWAGRVGEVRYPFDLTSAVTVPAKAKDYEQVTQEHMNSMLYAMCS